MRVHYTGRLDDGTVFDSPEGREPLQFTLGESQVIPGFEDAVTGHAVVLLHHLEGEALDETHAAVDAGETAAVVIMALTLSFLATLYPSWRAARLDPVEALRYE